MVDESWQSVMCPHFVYDGLAPVPGGFRFQKETKDAIDELAIRKDFDGLWQHLTSRNPLVRAYVARVYANLRAEESKT